MGQRRSRLLEDSAISFRVVMRVCCELIGLMVYWTVFVGNPLEVAPRLESTRRISSPDSVEFMLMACTRDKPCFLNARGLEAVVGRWNP